jgi:D-alanine-D-alanine ligase
LAKIKRQRKVKRFSKKAAFKKKRIGVLMGGESAEAAISLKSGASVLNALGERGFKLAEKIEAKGDLAGKLRRKKIEVAFIVLHGSPGEDGTVQGLLENMGIPYTGSGVLSSALCINKVVTKEVLHYHGILTPPYRVLNPGSGPPGGLKLPFVVKPPTEGSALGVTIVRKKGEFKSAMRKAGKFSKDVLVESYIEGRELTVGVMETGKALAVVEIRPAEDFYDFKAKYKSKGKTEYIVPAPLKAAEVKKVKTAALKTYKAMRCRGVARIDMIFSTEGAPYVIEVNTIPGMTEVSLLPMAAEEAGISYGALCEKILLGARLD